MIKEPKQTIIGQVNGYDYFEEIKYDDKGNIGSIHYSYKWSIPHREDGPSISYFVNGVLQSEQYHLHGKLHREDGPAVIYYCDNGIEIEQYYINSECHKIDGPAVIQYKNGEIIDQKYFFHGKNVTDLVNLHPDYLTNAKLRKILS